MPFNHRSSWTFHFWAAVHPPVLKLEGHVHKHFWGHQAPELDVWGYHPLRLCAATAYERWLGEFKIIDHILHYRSKRISKQRMFAQKWRWHVWFEGLTDVYPWQRRRSRFRQLPLDSGNAPAAEDKPGYWGSLSAHCNVTGHLDCAMRHSHALTLLPPKLWIQLFSKAMSAMPCLYSRGWPTGNC